MSSNVTKINSVVILGIDATDIEVQVLVYSGIPSFSIVGLADKTIAESKERVKAALNSMGLRLPPKKILVNLSPADLEKEGSHFDLAIAAAILTHLNILPAILIKKYIVLGELSLDGKILPSAGVLPAAVHATKIGKGIICPYDNSEEASWSENKDILSPKSLLELINHFKGISNLEKINYSFNPKKREENYVDLFDIVGQQVAKRALIIAAVGNHNLLMYGPPGVGKSMIAKSICSILPDMNKKEMLESSMIYSVAGLLMDGLLPVTRPFRSPHQSASLASIVGGGFGKKISPGEISLAHNGVLFLDELPEFNMQVIDSLRQPLENQEILITRVNKHIKYPADFLLIGAMNPCKCGYLGNTEKQCSIAPRCSQKYLSKISGPILDRFGMHIEINNISPFDKFAKNECESSELVLEKVIKARKRQQIRYKNYTFSTNSRATLESIKKNVCFTNEAEEILKNSVNKFKLSMRAYISIIRLAQTIVDFEDLEKIDQYAMSEAINYRCLKTILQN